MKEERSIFEYVNENISFVGKLCKWFDIKKYLNDVNGEDYNIEKEYLYNYKKNPIEIMLKGNDVIENVDFRIRLIVANMLNTFDSEELEKYCKGNEINIHSNLKSIINEIEKHEDIDKDKLKAFCKYNIMKTKNVFCMYIYLILLSYVKIENERLKSVVIKIALLDEFTEYINDYIIDKMDNPEEVRFYLLKRISSKNAKLSIIDKMKLDKIEEKWWIIFNFYDRDFSGKPNILKKLDMISILDKEDLTIEQYLACGKTIANGYLEYTEVPDGEDDVYLRTVKKYISLYQNYDNDIRVIEQIAKLDSSIKYIEKALGEKKYNEIRSYFKSNVQTENTKNVLIDCMSNEDLPDYTRQNYIELIGNLGFSELFLKIFNDFKKDPIKNYSMLYALSENKDILFSALEILDKAINWNELTGKYSSERVRGKEYKPVLKLLRFSCDFPDFAMEIYSKSLKAKNAFIREMTVDHLETLKFFDNTFTDKLEKSLKTMIKNEVVPELKLKAKNLLNENEIDSFESIERASKLNMVDNEQYSQDKSKDKKRKINLKEARIVNKMNFDECGPALSRGIDHLMCIYEEKNQFVSLVQGDEFGEEYTAKLTKDDEYNLTNVECTCNKCTMDKFCNHVALVLIYLSKVNDKREEENKNKKR